MSKNSKSRARKGQKQAVRRWAVPIALLVFIAIISMAYLAFQSAHETPITLWKLDNASRLGFEQREPVDGSSTVIESTPDYTVENVVYKSFGDNVHALLRIPKNITNPPVVIVLPAATVNKEADADMAKALASWGYASLTLDERGNNGSTPGPSAMDLNGGYQAFINNRDPVQYKQVFDVLQGYEYIKSRADLNGSNVAVLGESMGGRFAIVSAALEPGMKGAFVISSGPYGLDRTGNALADQFSTSVEPETYLSMLPPRKVVMFHFTGDKVIPVEQGKSLYANASEPKAWYEYSGDVHGVYSEIYAEDLRNELKAVLG
ncbi:alpha/beta hydrolase [Methanocella arvoryzae]|uniref:Hydrolase n=1 Tax=Methanocella arvoryzae (strain DSM 22066 / NBRC 105507 / MRE50) TaxID=351160 RepID=Q0W132_METAR|nr:alpha/beta fold hydrolase [Methanocella arvoryzae]CAJ37911.1 putative hydrolase [Methanocella arvoryzae MRE50]